MATNRRKNSTSTAKRSPLSAELRQSFDAMTRWMGPLAPPDRHWQAALDLAANPQSAELETVNPNVATAVEYLRAEAACATDAERAAVQVRWPALSQAHALFKLDGPKKWELEAWLLTTESVKDIAARCGVAPAIVAAYRRWFFSVRREYREEPDLLRQKMFTLWIDLTFRDNELGRLWAWTALAEGPESLELLIETFYNAWRSDMPPTLSTYLRPKAEVPLVIQASVARAILLPCTKTMPAIFEFALRVIEADRGDPQERQEKLDDLFRLMVKYTLAYLDGQSASKLQRLLRRPSQRQKNRGEQSRDPSIPTGAMETMKNAGRMETPTGLEVEEMMMKTAVAKGRSGRHPLKPKAKPSHIEMVDLLDLGGMAFGGE